MKSNSVTPALHPLEEEAIRLLLDDLSRFVNQGFDCRYFRNRLAQELIKRCQQQHLSSSDATIAAILNLDKDTITRIRHHLLASSISPD